MWTALSKFIEHDIVLGSEPADGGRQRSSSVKLRGCAEGFSGCFC
jgi:hypothetical protein